MVIWAGAGALSTVGVTDLLYSLAFSLPSRFRSRCNAQRGAALTSRSRAGRGCPQGPTSARTIRQNRSSIIYCGECRRNFLPGFPLPIYEALDFRFVDFHREPIRRARGAAFERAEVTKAINIVSLLPRNTKAVRGDVVSGDSALKTGESSRAELEFPDLTITRVGSNALFRFLAGSREITLDGGTMLFSSPKGAGGGKVQVGAITAAVTGTDFLISRIAGRIKVICLTGKVLVYFTANPKLRVVLKPGQMVDIPAGATKMPPIVTINLRTLSPHLSSSIWERFATKRHRPERQQSKEFPSGEIFPGCE